MTQRCKKRPGDCKCDEAELAANALEKAVLALGKLRSRMSAAERQDSERRLKALLSNKSGDMPYADDRHAAKAELKYLAARALPEEQAVAGIYKRQEDRIGMSRKRKVRQVALTNKRSGQIVAGYVSEAEPSVVNFTDHGLAMERHPNGWLAPVALTTSFTRHVIVTEEVIDEKTGEKIVAPVLDEAGKTIRLLDDKKQPVTRSFTGAGTGGCWRGLDDMPAEVQEIRQQLANLLTLAGFNATKSRMERVPRGGHEYAPPFPGEPLEYGKPWPANTEFGSVAEGYVAFMEDTGRESDWGQLKPGEDNEATVRQDGEGNQGAVYLGHGP